jgi:CRP-like cAMP-binding protein
MGGLAKGRSSKYARTKDTSLNMFPESLQNLVFSDRLEFVTGQSLAIADGGGPFVYLLMSGCVTLINRLGATSAVFWPGDLIVVPAGLPGTPMLVKAVAETHCLRGRQADLMTESGKNPEIARWVWQQQSRREAELHRRLELLTAETVERRVLLTVADLADRSNIVSPGNPMPLAQNEVAELAGATRETTSTLLNRMRRRGMVVLGRRRIVVAAPDVLRALNGLGEDSEAEPAASEAELAGPGLRQ